MSSERKSLRTIAIGLLLLGMLLLLVIHIGRGSNWINPAQVLTELFRGPQDQPERFNSIVWALRLPRALYCVLIGALLAMVGSVFQALFRNPLADPYVVGVSSGAAIGSALALVLGFGGAWEGIWSGMGATAVGFVTGLITLFAVFAIAKRGGVLETQNLLLAGVVVGSLLAALLSLVLISSGKDTTMVLRWLLGSLTPTYWNRVGLMAIVLAIGAPVLLLQSRRLNVFAIGEDAAMRLGVNVHRLKPVILVAGTAMTAVTVGSVGIIGFLGLVAPHIARRVVGVDWRWSLVGSGLVGSILLLAADLIAQHAIPGTELNVGIVTSVLGAPFLLILMKKQA